MPYSVKEVFYTLQGEGRHSGRPSVFCRFAGCNLWNGREEGRADAVCRFCDTDFVGTDGLGGGRFETARDLARHIVSFWPGGGQPFVVCTGGEPLLQLDAPLIESIHQAGMEIAIETNGTLPVPEGIDWVCVSPKAEADLVVKQGHELKLVYPQQNGSPERYANLDFEYFYLQPMDGPEVAENTRLALAYCLEHPQWRLSLQTHKILQIR